MNIETLEGTIAYLRRVLVQISEVTSLGGSDNVNTLNTTLGWVDGMVAAALLAVTDE